MRRFILKHKLLLLVVVIILASVFALRQIGKIYSSKVKNTNDTYYQNIIKKEQTLQKIVLGSLTRDDQGSDTNFNQRFASKDLNIIEDNSQQTVRTYALNIVSILKPYSQSRPNEAKVVVEALNARNPNLLKPLNTTVTLHKTTIQKLLLVQVPSSAVLVHLRLTNSLAQALSALDTMDNVFTEPKTALAEAEKYYATASNFFWATDNINAYFANQGIVFNEQEKLTLYFNLK